MQPTTDIVDLVHREAQLLDDWLLDDWLDLYTEDAVYWIPIDEHADPVTHPSIVHERKPILRLRVEQLMRENRLAQTPRSQIMRLVGNIVMLDDQDGTHRQVRYNLLATELRSGDWRQRGLGDKRTFSGYCRLRLRRVEDAWRIAAKTIVLLERHQPVMGLSFIL